MPATRTSPRAEAKVLKNAGEVFDFTFGHSLAPEVTDQVLQHYFPLGELAGRKVLDAGCRVGDYAAALVRQGAREVVGVDLSARCVEEARRKYAAFPGMRFFEGDIADLSRFEDSSFDAVFCSGTMAYLPPEAAGRALREFVRVTRPGGVLLVLFLRDRGPLFRLATWIADRIPLRLYRLLVNTFGSLLRPLASRLLGRPVGADVLKNDILWGLQGNHYGVPVEIPDEFRVETVRCESCSPETTVSYRIIVPEPKSRLAFQKRIHAG